MFTAAVYIITVIQTQPKCLLINEMDNDYTHIHRYIYIYTHTHTHTHTHTVEYYLAIKRMKSCPL